MPDDLKTTVEDVNLKVLEDGRILTTFKQRAEMIEGRSVLFKFGDSLLLCTTVDN